MRALKEYQNRRNTQARCAVCVPQRIYSRRLRMRTVTALQGENYAGKIVEKLLNLFERLPYRERGISINADLLRTTVELLNAVEGNILPQNCRNDIAERTPDGLDKRIKIALQSDTRTANIVSDELAKKAWLK